MSSVNQRFTKFLQNLQLTKSQIEDAITKHTGVRSALHNHYYGSQKSAGMPYDYAKQLVSSYANYDVFKESSTAATSYLVGSYGKNTAIRPPSDIDILFIMPPDLWSKYDSYNGNGQSRLLQDVKNVLLQTYTSTDIRGDRQVVSVKFTSYAVEVVPAFSTYLDYYKIPDTSGGGSWSDTDPKAEKSALSESNGSCNGNTIRLIKMMKRWKNYCNVTALKSLAIELTVVHFLSSYAHAGQSATYYDWMVRDYLDYLIKHKSYSYQIPGISEQLYLGSDWVSRAETAYSRAKKACDYESAKCPRCATDEWKKIFGSDFEYLD